MGTNLRKHCTYANVVATLALLFAMGGTAAAAVMITSNSQVAKNTISGHHPPSGAHANIISASVNGTDLAGDVKSSFKTHCPNGMVRNGDVCFQTSTHTGDYYTALAACSNMRLRLPTATELTEVFNDSSADQPEQWTDGWYYSTSSPAAQGTALSQDTSRQIHFTATDVGDQNAYRCVVTPSN
jgi:hypothetical protein